jgi:Zn-dependent peptidase ImmA (M78 family)
MTYEINVRGKKYIVLIRRPPRQRKQKKFDYGACYFLKQKIFLNPYQSKDQMLNTVIHELLHACLPDLEEFAVDETATVISRFLKAHQINFDILKFRKKK